MLTGIYEVGIRNSLGFFWLQATENKAFQKKWRYGETYWSQNRGFLRTEREARHVAQREWKAEDCQECGQHLGLFSASLSILFPSVRSGARAWHSEESDFQPTTCCLAEWKESIIWIRPVAIFTEPADFVVLRYWCLRFRGKEAEVGTRNISPDAIPAESRKPGRLFQPIPKCRAQVWSAPATVVGRGCTSMSSRWPLNGRAISS